MEKTIQPKLGHLTLKQKFLKNWPLHLMLLPCVLLVLLFNYAPMVGISIAFQQYNPTKGFFGSKWVGLKYFESLFKQAGFWRACRNSLVISVLKIVCGQMMNLLFALLLNEMRQKRLKKTIHAITMFPHFVSWVVVASIIRELLYTDGIINTLLLKVGLINSPIFFLGSSKAFLPMLIVTDVWKGFGYGSIIITAALAGIDPTLYEAATVDGANRWKQTIHVTLPGVSGTVVMLMMLSIGGILSAGFDQIYNLYNTLVYDVADVIDTYVYRLGVEQAQFSMSTAVGVFRSIIGAILTLVANGLAYKYTDYRVF